MQFLGLKRKPVEIQTGEEPPVYILNRKRRPGRKELISICCQRSGLSARLNDKPRSGAPLLPPCPRVAASGQRSPWLKDHSETRLLNSGVEAHLSGGPQLIKAAASLS